jgi:NAD(P)-dependent dehydrogenase (short-subunit alcohol dehydrogenase family)
MTRALLAAGIRVAGVDRDREPLEAIAASAREQGKAADLLPIQNDLTRDSAAEEITKATRTRFGRIDILINNAGIGPGLNPTGHLRTLQGGTRGAQRDHGEGSRTPRRLAGDALSIYARRADPEYPSRLRMAALSQRRDAPGRFQPGGGRRQCADSRPSQRGDGADWFDPNRTFATTNEAPNMRIMVNTRCLVIM